MKPTLAILKHPVTFLMCSSLAIAVIVSPRSRAEDKADSGAAAGVQLPPRKGPASQEQQSLRGRIAHLFDYMQASTATTASPPAPQGATHSEPLIFIPTSAIPTASREVDPYSVYLLTFDPADPSSREAYQKAHSMLLVPASRTPGQFAAASVRDLELPRSPPRSEAPASGSPARNAIGGQEKPVGSEPILASDMARVKGRVMEKGGLKAIIISAVETE